jgi:hypothetical protein
MYSVVDLAKMFNTTRSTIYNKLESESIQEYIITTKQGKRLQKDGINVFQLIMAESKVVSNATDIQQINKQVDNNLNTDYIDSLNKQIEELKNDKTRLYKELDTKNDLLSQQQFQITDLINKNNNLLLLEKNPEKDVKEKKKFWWFRK